MQTHQLIQGSPEWFAFRQKHHGASEAPAALGKSKYMTRTALLHQKHTGLSVEVDDGTQARFDKGNEAEIGGRAMAEQIIGESLSPVVVSKDIDGLPLSASLDGITFDGDIIFEHKLFSDSLAEQIASLTLDEHYTIQMDQQLLVTGAEKCLFMASDGTAENMAYCWYKAGKKQSDQLIVGWLQFEKDLAAYIPSDIEEKPIPTAVMALPALAVTIHGEVTTSNLPAFVGAADAFLSQIKTVLATDQDFADAEANVKACDAAEKGIEAAKKAITAQVADIDTVMRTMDLYRDKLRDVRLRLKKLVDTEKDARKQEIFQNAVRAFSKHVEALEAETVPIRLNLVRPDFASAMKGLKNLSAMQDAVNTALANGKIAADAVAKDIRGKLAWFSAAVDPSETNSASLRYLFADLQQIIGKPTEDFALTVTSRIEAQKKAEAEKLEAERNRIRLEEEAKARAKVGAELKPIAQVVHENHLRHFGPDVVSKERAPFIPTSEQLVEAVASVFDVDNGTALTWLSQADFTIHDYVE